MKLTPERIFAALGVWILLVTAAHEFTPRAEHFWIKARFKLALWKWRLVRRRK